MILAIMSLGHLMGQMRSMVKRRKKVEAMDQRMITIVARVWIPRR